MDAMLGERLRKSRQRAGLIQTELAIALGRRYNAQMISMLEHNQRGIHFDGATEAARELGVSLDYLAGLTDTPAPAATLAAELAQERAKSELDDAGALATSDSREFRPVLLVLRVRFDPRGGNRRRLRGQPRRRARVG